MKRWLLALLFLGFAGGCSKPTWIAKIYVVRAENAYSKGHALRVKKVSYEERLKYYRTACEDFLKAYESDPSVFTLYRIELAADACLRRDDKAAVELFRQFEAEYIQKHPTEVEYGDAGAWMSIE
jgi:hypothetical protein